MKIVNQILMYCCLLVLLFSSASFKATLNHMSSKGDYASHSSIAVFKIRPVLGDRLADNIILKVLLSEIIF